jgi:hypothetical protein
MAATAEVAERRKFKPRTCISDLHVLCNGVGQHIDVRPPDVSARGMFINTPQSFPIGMAVTVRFRLGHPGRHVQAQGEVRYCLDGVGIVVEFTAMSEEARRTIEEEVCACGDDW